MIIEISEYDLKGKNIWETSSYPSSGLYMVNDGLVSNIVLVSEQKNAAVMAIPIPFEQIEKHIVQVARQESETRFYQQFTAINNKLDEMKTEQLPLVSQPYQPEKIDGDTLLKAIAIAQNPELALKLLKDEE